MNLVKTRDMERISRRAEEAEMAVSASMARLIAVSYTHLDVYKRQQ